MKEAIRNMTEEQREVYFNPPEELRMQRAQAFKRNVYDPYVRGDKVFIKNVLRLDEGETLSQNDFLMRYLLDYSSITPLEALTAFGCMRLSARVANLRDDGIPIDTEIHDGKKKYAIYRLTDEEEGGENDGEQ